MKIKRNIFIFNRPLQYLNLKGILSELNKDEENILLVHANFNDGSEFCENIISQEDIWTEVKYITSRMELLRNVMFFKASRLYLNTDLGFNYLICLFSFCKEIYVYEEGWGSYNKKIVPTNAKSRFKNYLYQLIGSGNAMGHSKLTKGIYVYQTKLYHHLFPDYNKQILDFSLPFSERVENEKKFFQSIFNYNQEIVDYNEQKVLIYATGWNIDKNVLNKINDLKDDYDVILLKLHPHIKKSDIIDFDYKTLSQNVMLEFYLVDLISQNNEVTVYHDNSFSVFYFLDKIKAVNVGRERKDYNKIASFYEQI